MNREEVIRIFSVKIRKILRKQEEHLEEWEEIRLRTGQPLEVICRGKRIYLSEDGETSGWETAYRVRGEDVRETLEYISRYSLYAFSEEVRQGFLTIPGGHRVGAAGHVIRERDGVRGISPIAFLNIRLAHQICGAADAVLPFLWEDHRLGHTLILSPPGLGKTTLLRDIIRQISNGYRTERPLTVGVVDERSEIAACSGGVPQNDVGRHTDVLDTCPKAEGVRMLLRSRSPHVIAMDEVGCEDDMEALSESIGSGCTLLATVHAVSMEDLKRRPVLSHLVERGLFERYVTLARRNGHVGWNVRRADGAVLGEGLR